MVVVMAMVVGVTLIVAMAVFVVRMAMRVRMIVLVVRMRMPVVMPVMSAVPIAVIPMSMSMLLSMHLRMRRALIFHPKPWYRIPNHAPETTKLLQRIPNAILDIRRQTEQQPHTRALDQRHRRREDEDCDDAGGQGVPACPAIVLGEQGGDDDGDGTEGVSENMQEDTLHILIVMVMMPMSTMAVVIPLMSMSMIMRMPMPMMRMSKSRQPHNIHQKPQHTDNQQLIQTVQLCALINPLKSIEDNFHADKHEEDSVCEAREGVDFTEAVGKARVGAPFAHDGGGKADGETGAVEEHVDAVGKEAEGAGYVAVEELDEHEGQIEAWERC